MTRVNRLEPTRWRWFIETTVRTPLFAWTYDVVAKRKLRPRLEAPTAVVTATEAAGLSKQSRSQLHFPASGSRSDPAG